MANKLGLVTLNELCILELDSDPRTGAGFQCAVGSLAMIQSERGDIFYKYGSAATNWQIVKKRSFIKYRNSNTTTNLNADTSAAFNTQVPIIGTQYFSSENIGDFSISGQNIITQYNGFVRFFIDMTLVGSGFFSAQKIVQLCIKKNGAILRPYGSVFVDANGDDYSGSFKVDIDCSIGDSFGLFSRQERGGNPVVMVLDACEITAERI